MCFHLFSLQDDVAADFIKLTKTLYDLQKADEPAECKGSPLAQLVVENFDEEQIWQELELQNNAVLKYFNTAINEVLSNDTLTTLLESEESAEEEEEEGEEEDGEKALFKHSKRLAVESKDEDYTDEDSDLDFDVDALEKQEKQKKEFGKNASKTKVVPSEVDDKFFKLSEMESFLDEMDKREGKEDDENVDYFHDLPSDENDDLDLDHIGSFRNQKQNKTNVCLLSCTFTFSFCAEGLGNRKCIDHF